MRVDVVGCLNEVLARLLKRGQLLDQRVEFLLSLLEVLEYLPRALGRLDKRLIVVESDILGLLQY